MPLYIFSVRSRRLSHEIENDPFEEIYSRHELLSYFAEEEICSFIFMKLLKKHSILVASKRGLLITLYNLDKPLHGSKMKPQVESLSFNSFKYKF